MKNFTMAVLFTILISSSAAFASQTENLGIRVLPAPGKVTIDGKTDDWDLSGGIFACDDVENQHGKYALWIHMMYDAENLYVMAHFIDETPMNNPGQTIGDYGFAGDSLQMRFFFGPQANGDEGPQSRISHWTCWYGRDQKDIMDVAYGQKFDQGSIKSARTQGAQQAFLKDADGKGYVQELAIPWKLVTKDGNPLKAGDKFITTAEPNFTVGGNSRLSVKDIFRAGITLDRVFTFQGPRCWGWATCETQGHVAPQPVRLADTREFPVKLDQGALTVDWTGLIKKKELLGFKPVKFNMPADGYISLNIDHPDGSVARQLLNAAWYTKGEHEVLWDGLGTPSWTRPGKPVEPGEYVWSALYHTGLGLRLKGWACNAGNAPWDGPTGKENWGGDEGYVVACAADASSVYLGWGGAEAGKALLACDLKGNIKWKNNRQGMSGALLVAVDNGIVYAVNWGQNESNYVYRVAAADGTYSSWSGSDTPDLFPRNLWADAKGKPDHVDGMDAKGGKLFLSYTNENTLMVVDGASGKLLRSIEVKAPCYLKAASDSLLYCVSAHNAVLAINPSTGEVKPFLTDLKEVYGLAVDKDGRVYVGMREPDNQVKIYTPDGKQTGTIGRPGGRAKIGPWTPDGMLSISEMAVDAEGKLWVAEADSAPKRVSVWDTKTGKLTSEFFGPSSYGALGGGINPVDANLMVGQGCEWRIDPQTGRAACLGTITRDGMENSRFGIGSNGKLYLAVAANWAFNVGPLKIYERLGDAKYKLRSEIYYVDAAGKEIPMTGHGQPTKAQKTVAWASESDNENEEGTRKENELNSVAGELRFSGWYMSMTPDLTLYSGDNQYKVAGFTAAGAPKYDLSKPVKMPAAGLGSADGRFVLHPGDYGQDHTTLNCFEIASGKQMWSYPDNFNGVHGSHNAPPAEPALILGSYGPCGSVKLPDPVGNIWVLPTNVGQWHILTEHGFYLSSLFQGDAMKFVWPEKAVPGAIMDNCPCGMGGEDFGGSLTLGNDGKLYVQSGKTGFWNLEVTGLENVKEIKGVSIPFSAADVTQAATFHDNYLQKAAGAKRLAIKKNTPLFTGNIEKDFAGADLISFKKSDDAGVHAAAQWDDQNLYVAWDVNDATPWKNSASVPEEMYLHGDTVDFQLGTDAAADKNRADAVLGDLRLSIGNLKGKASAVIFRKVAKEKHSKIFSSGVVKEYVMDSVDTVPGATLKVTPRDRGYVMEAAIPLSALDFKPAPGVAVHGDFGATHGDQAGQRTRLRTYWSNQHTGIVDDAVFELQMEPKYWGELIFQ